MTRIKTIFFLLIFSLTACQTQGTRTIPVGIGTPTAILTPSPMPSPSSSPSPVAATETFAPAPRSFTEEFNGSLPYWTFLQIENGGPAASPAIRNGTLVFDLPSINQWLYAFYNGPEYTDTRVDAQVEMPSSGDGTAGVICRYDKNNGWYEFNIHTDKSYEILYGQWLTQGVARFTPIVRTQSEKIKDGLNEIGLLCQGDTLTPYINAVQMRKRVEAKFALTNGTIGISASSFITAPSAIIYNWVKVSEP